MKIINYPHPTLRHKSKPVKRVDRELRNLVAEMFELMYDAKGIGLAANQVDLPLQLFIINLAGEEGNGEELVFINPVLSAPRGQSEREEGCLSLPGIHADISRPETIHVTAYDLTGNQFDSRVDEMLARAIQHEQDHLEGVLFIDRLHEQDLKQLSDELHELELEMDSQRIQDLILPNEAIQKRLSEIETRYC